MRKTIGRFSAAAAVTTAAALTLLSQVPAAASVVPHHTINCPTGRIATLEDNVPLTSGPNSTRVVAIIPHKGDQISCIQGVYTGQVDYTRCGGGNAYIAVHHEENGQDVIRYTYSKCWADQ